MIASSGLTRSKPRDPRTVIAAAIIGSWTVLLAAGATGNAELLNHDALAEAQVSAWVSIGLFLVAWQVMTASMMLPSSLPMIRLFFATAARQERPAIAQLAFLSAYLLVWSAFGIAAFLGDQTLHFYVHRVPWLEAHEWLIAPAVLAGAGLFQFSSLKERCLTECRHPAAFLMQHYRRGAGAAFRLGRKHGMFCLGCCWALMLVAFAAGVQNLWWMAGLTAVMVYEKVGRHGNRITPFVGAALLGLALLVVVDPTWLPPIFGVE